MVVCLLIHVAVAESSVCWIFFFIICQFTQRYSEVVQWVDCNRLHPGNSRRVSVVSHRPQQSPSVHVGLTWQTQRM